MTISQKIAQCNPDVKLQLSPEVFEDISQQIQIDMESIKDGEEKMQMYLNYADYCTRMYMDKDALHYYILILEENIFKDTIPMKIKEIMGKAYDGLKCLLYSNDEYVWESATNIIDRYEYLFKENDVI